MELSKSKLTPTYLVTGIAGSGKTALFKRVIAERPSFGVMCATTGVAAVNLGAQTIHSFMSYSDLDDLRRVVRHGGFLNRLKKQIEEGELWPGAVVVIDEKSMLNAEQLDITFDAFEQLNRWLDGRSKYGSQTLQRLLQKHVEPEWLDDSDPYEAMQAATRDEATLPSPEPESPFVGLALVGDFCQLPPVEGEFAFKAKCWPSFEANRINLSGSYRQTSGSFIDALNLARRGQGPACVDLLQQLGVEFTGMNDMHFDGVSVFGLNKDVQWLNDWRYAKLDVEEFAIPASRVGQQKKDWQKKEIVPDVLKLKVGCRVMVTSNSQGGRLVYANGDMGTIVAIGKRATTSVVDKVAIVLDRNQQTVEITMCEREWIDPAYHGPKWKAKEDGAVIGSVVYMPLKLGYALTVHKTQGLSLDRVQFNISNPFTGGPAMAYTALSRARTPEGLRIIGTPSLLASRINTHPGVSHWL